MMEWSVTSNAQIPLDIEENAYTRVDCFVIATTRKLPRSVADASGAPRQCSASSREWKKSNRVTQAGRTRDPTYEQVCSGKTGHAEVVQITFNPRVISYKELLEIFFTVHDPTTLNRQGADVGTQYRSIILYHNDEQKAVAEQAIREVDSAQIWNRPIVTQVKPLEMFYRAEEYHQQYFKQNPRQPYCQLVISPKVAKLRQHYLAKLKIAT